jgi:hypothetical protein
MENYLDRSERAVEAVVRASLASRPDDLTQGEDVTLGAGAIE